MGKLLLLTIVVGVALLTGCSSTHSVVAVQPDQRVLARVVAKVGAYYGDAQPQVAKVTPDINEQQQQMAFVFLTGTFHHGTVVAPHVSFSMLNDGSFVWAIRGYDDTNQALWTDSTNVCPC